MSAPWEASFRGWRVGGVHLYRTHSSPQTVERTKSQVGALAVDHVYLQQHRNGRSGVDTPSGERLISHGDIALVDMAQPVLGWSTTKVDSIGLCIPRRAFDARVGEIGDLHRSVLSRSGSALTRLLSDHMATMADCLDASDETQRGLLSVATAALCNAALTPVSDSGHNRPAVVAIEIRQFIEANLGRFDLGVEMLCARFGLSRTPLFAIFEEDRGVLTYVRTRRLAMAMRMLSGVDAGGPDRVSGVAYACGYENQKSFSKAFRARYGVNPRDVDRNFAVGSRWETGATLLSWMKEL
ncbi:AraC family transcriptional regulator [Methylobacterium gossipiicola]|uniref:AraC-type DNA-binding protein n=1 Tax=Methylobacterium gossipiicola TaxID=582675 RepID=A0A1I2SZB0_9HYPH|nr:AraC family transcriptional regulator [Methylobacterium gossipiicola]SFG57900.1 AraC-type DNA-binding protein [Methylobacterium gossipiicola]